MSDKYSHEFNRLVEHLHQLQGVGRRTALRYALDVLKWEPNELKEFGQLLQELPSRIQYCTTCYNLSDTPQCNICSNPAREDSQICVVQDIRDVIAIENTSQFNGKYHVLGGKISPMEGIGPNELRIDELHERVSSDHIKEVILALSTDMEGETTSYYIYKKLAGMGVQFSTIARGVALGDELEYTDEQTLGNSIRNRVPYEKETAG